jgi:hypothetical protein
MTTIRCQDAFILTTDFDACAKELNASRAAFQTPLHVTCGQAARRAVIPCIRVHGLAIEFDESKSTKSAGRLSQIRFSLATAGGDVPPDQPDSPEAAAKPAQRVNRPCGMTQCCGRVPLWPGLLTRPQRLTAGLPLP